MITKATYKINNLEDKIDTNTTIFISFPLLTLDPYRWNSWVDIGYYTEIATYSVLSGHSKTPQKLAFNTDFRLMQVKSIAECSMGSILQYFSPSLCYHFPLKLFLSISKWPLKTGFTVLISIRHDMPQSSVIGVRFYCLTPAFSV